MNLLEVNNICQIYGSSETAVHALKLLNTIGALDTHNSSIAQTADRILQVSDGVPTDLGRCRE